MLWDGERNRPVFVSEEMLSLTAKEGAKIRVPVVSSSLTAIRSHEEDETAEVAPVPTTATLPLPVISSWPGGAPEEFANMVGWRYSGTTPPAPSVAILLDISMTGMAGFYLVLGGKPFRADIQFSTLLGLEKRQAGADTDTFSVTIDPGAVTITKNRVISEWTPIIEAFRGSLSSAGINHTWTEGPGVYTRYP